jgi:eukaryotic-like serine/threonine-protein kinase
VVISPDGTRVAYIASQFETAQQPGTGRIFVRAMSNADARPLGDGANLGIIGTPFFSPDGQWIGFWSEQDSTLKKIAVSGGAALTICKADTPLGVSWEGDAIFFGQSNKGIMRVSEDGGTPEVVARVNSSEFPYGPQLIDGGRSLLFTLATGQGSDRWDTALIVVQSLRSGDRKVVMRGGSDARLLPTGHLVYALGGSLLAVPFDETEGRVRGTPVPILEDVRRSRRGTILTGSANFAFSANGTLVYVPGRLSSTVIPRTLVLVDRAGHVQPLPLPPQLYAHPRISPDGRRLALGTDDGKQAIVWVVGLAGRRASGLRRFRT